MENIDNLEVLKENLNNKRMVLIYFGSKTCGVCKVIKPKIEDLLKDYPLVSGFNVDIEEAQQLSAAYNIFTIPGVLVFIKSKEIIREARYINMQDIAMKIERYYNLLFKD